MLVHAASVRTVVVDLVHDRGIGPCVGHFRNARGRRKALVKTVGDDRRTALTAFGGYEYNTVCGAAAIYCRRIVFQYRYTFDVIVIEALEAAELTGDTVDHHEHIVVAGGSLAPNGIRAAVITGLTAAV